MSLEPKGFLHVKNFLHQSQCKFLTKSIQKMVKNGIAVNDAQCPLSWAIYSAPIFDILLEQCVSKIQGITDKRVYPTYAYARLYAPGEELKAHTDRPSCEISATVTLGFEGGVWPIYMGDYAKQGSGRQVIMEDGSVGWATNTSKIEMNVGDAVIYRGMDKPHWRDVYKEGKWQAQVFLHYVDANGPYANFIYDKRPNLAHVNHVQKQIHGVM